MREYLSSLHKWHFKKRHRKCVSEKKGSIFSTLKQDFYVIPTFFGHKQDIINTSNNMLGKNIKRKGWCEIEIEICNQHY